MNQKLISQVLSRYGSKKLPFNAMAWAHYRQEAEDRKVWALLTQYNQAWKDGSCQMSLEMLDKSLSTPVLVLAAQFYAYGHYRANAVQGHYQIDPQANALWETFKGEQ